MPNNFINSMGVGYACKNSPNPNPTKIEPTINIKSIPSMRGIDFLNPCLAPDKANTILAGPGLAIRGNTTANHAKKYSTLISFS